MSTEVRPAHSPLGASGAERWMNCPGSVALLKALTLPPSDDPTYRSEGTSAHEAGYFCLVKGMDAWEVIGEKFGKHEITHEMSIAIQVYIDEVHSLITPTAKVYYEFGIDAPEFHKDFYGTLDNGIVDGITLFINDYKHGEGIMVDVEYNPQIMYYAYGLLRHHPEVENIELRIIQPRGFHPEGPVRKWVCPAEHIRQWAERELKPAMDRTELDHDLDAGPWCRFCPAKLVCPLMTSLFGAAMMADPKVIINLSNESLGRSYQYKQAVNFYIKALDDETMRRLNNGEMANDECGVKLVPKKTNRVYVANVEIEPGQHISTAEFFKSKFGEEAMTQPELKSPAEMAKLGKEAAALIKEYAYTPFNGTTVALSTDKRPAVKVQTTAEAFPNAVAAAGGNDVQEHG